MSSRPLPERRDFATSDTLAKSLARNVMKRMPSPSFFFFRQFLKSPGMVGSIIPTARATIDRLLAPVDWSGVRCVVEYGPGTGVFTRAMLELLPPSAHLIAIDTNAEFIAHLEDSIDDARLICVEGSAADVEAIVARHGFSYADYVVSGLPFSTLPEGVEKAIMAATARAIRPGGAFMVYQYSQFVLPLLRAEFAEVRTRLSWLCIPPARLFWAHKPSAPGLSAEVEPASHSIIEHADDLVSEPPAH